MNSNTILRRLAAWSLVVLGLLLVATVAYADITTISIQNGPNDDGTNITSTICTNANQNKDVIYVQYDNSPLTPTDPLGTTINDLSGTTAECTRDGSPVAPCGGPTFTCTFAKPAGTAYFRYVGANAPGGGRVVVATSTTAVELASFDAVAEQGSGVVLSWETATEIDHAGFNVYRSHAEQFDRVASTQINAALIAAQGSFGQGASYSLRDNAVPAGVWYYFLEDVDIYGSATVHGPVRVDLSQPTSTSLTALDGNRSLPLLPAVVVLTIVTLLVAFRAPLGTIWASFAGIIVKEDRS